MSTEPALSTEEVRRQTALHIARYWAQFAKIQLDMVKEAIKQADLHYQEASKVADVSDTRTERVLSTGGESYKSEPLTFPSSSDDDNRPKHRNTWHSSSATPARRGKRVSFSIEPVKGPPSIEQPRTPYPVDGSIDKLSSGSHHRDLSMLRGSKKMNEETTRLSEPLLDPGQLLAGTSTAGKDIKLVTRRTSAPQRPRSPIVSLETVSTFSSDALPYRPKLRHPSIDPLPPANIQLTSSYLSDLERQRAISRYMDLHTLPLPNAINDLNAFSSAASTSAKPPSPKQTLQSTSQAWQQPNKSEDLIKGLVQSQQGDIECVESESEEDSQTGERFKNLERQLGGICTSSNIPTPTSPPNIVQLNSSFDSDPARQVAAAKQECDRLEAAIKELTEQNFEDIGVVGAGVETNGHAAGRHKDLGKQLGEVQK